jgi:hypothetical protein
MRNAIPILMLAFLVASCSHFDPPVVDPFALQDGEADANPSEAIWEFDLLRDSSLITSVDVITLRGWGNFDPLGMVVTNDTLVVADARCEIDTIFTNSPHWPQEEFLSLFDEFESKRTYGDCFCSPKHVLAASFYVETDQSMDPFGDNGKRERTRVAVALMDETHNSVLVSDMKHGPRSYRFSVGHSQECRVPRFVSKVMAELGIEYEFLKR